MTHRADVGVIGAGIVGLAFAWQAARRGKSVVLFDRTDRPLGASVRNFGMVWPIGQPAGPAHQCALRSRQLWLELRDRANLWVSECGSLHVAHADDEDAVLKEFAQLAPGLGVTCTYLSAAETIRQFPAVNSTALLSTLHSP